ncbi:MAG: aspartyl-tRNA(Asn)/glutamyl-tRNA(Gln) amidotransferase subunit C [Phycisphaerales bacterium]|jgi:aspartyl-tRNA(Asn)/glutamyl-tRNA(Gln) amidotransferase subunit C
MADPLDTQAVQKIAKLARLHIPDDQAERVGADLSAILGYVERLGALDLEGVEPMAHVGDEVNRLGADEPSETLSNEALLKMAPDAIGPFVRVPKVLDGGEGGGA